MGKGTVLIVDDIEMNRELLAEILEDDYNALMAADGYEALRILEENYSRISAQLVSLADVYDALVNDRCYKKAFPKDVAFDMIMTGKCGVFSPKLLECFVECRPEMENLADQTKISIPIAKR